MEESAPNVPMSNLTEKLKSRDLPIKKEDSKEGEDIEDEVGEQYDEDDIEDFYGTVDEKKKPAQKEDEEIKADGENEEDMDLDLDYSQTHLDDFLKSQTSSSMMKGTNIQSGQLLNSFLSTYNKARSGTGASSLAGTGTGTGIDQSAALV